MTFTTLHDPLGIPGALAGGYVAIGNFDGVHRGHKCVLARTRREAQAVRAPALALTFSPHPRSYFLPHAPVPLLTPPEVRDRLLHHAGMDAAVTLTFDAALAGLSAEAFVETILIDRLKAAGVTVGHDFHFGKGRAGSPAFLADYGVARGLSVVVVPPFGEGAPVSSSRVRACLSEGDVAGANALLGHRWFVSGTVEHGDKRGRELGYPTANITLDPAPPLAFGIYAVRVRVAGKIHDAVASYGRRPMFDNGAARLEVFLFDFTGDLYGMALDVEFVARLRGEARFDTVAALITQMDQDSADARKALRHDPAPDAPSLLGLV